jgi:hypothetical protein
VIVETPSVEDVARRYGQRPGFTLVSQRDVALPMWRFNTILLTLAHRQIPPLQEFALKVVSAGLATTERVSGFLGIEEPVAVATLATLMNDDYLGSPPTDEGEAASFTLTPKGRRVLAEAEVLAPEERVYQLHYDGLLRRVVSPGNLPLYRPQESRELGLFEIPPFPADPPNADELSVTEIKDLFAVIAGGTDVPRDVLAVQGISGRRERVLRRATALVFEALKGIDVEVAFFIDGRPAPEVDHAFAVAEGARKLGILQGLRRERSDNMAASLLPREILAQKADASEVQAIQRRVEGLRQTTGEIEERLSHSTQPAEEDAAREELMRATEGLVQAEAVLDQFPVRPLEVYDHPAFLRQALTESTERMLIVSPWIRASVVDDTFVGGIRAALRRGVRILIGYGSGEDERALPKDKAAEERLTRLAAEEEGLIIARLGDTHAKILVVDQRFAIVGSFNWLSFRGDPAKPFRDERSVLVAIPEVIDDLYSSFEQRIVA